MSAIVDDLAIWPLLSELKSCLCAEVPDNCFCGIIIGNDSIPVGLDEYETPPVAYVRLNNGFPSTTFPLADQEANCFTTMAYDITVGVLRCAPMGEDGAPPTSDEMNDYARQALADMALIRRVLRCCLGRDKFPNLDQWVGQWTPIPIEGGYGGGEQQIIIGELI